MPRPNPRWISAIKAGFAYFATVFFVAFLIGIFRVTILAPWIGPVSAVLIELPAILAISWFSSIFLVRWFSVANQLRPRALMGGLAFGLLMMTEAWLAHFMAGQALPDFLASFRELAAILGLIGQLLFALIPMAQIVARGGR